MGREFNITEKIVDDPRSQYVGYIDAKWVTEDLKEAVLSRVQDIITSEYFGEQQELYDEIKAMFEKEDDRQTTEQEAD